MENFLGPKTPHVIEYVPAGTAAIVMAVEEGEACVMWAR
jgi:hypothetical protein